MGIIDGIKKVFDTLPDLASSVISLVLVIIIGALVAGVFTYQSVTSGNIDIDTTSSELIGNQTSNLSNIVGTMWTAATSVTGFIVIGAIVLIATAVMGPRLFGGRSGGSL